MKAEKNMILRQVAGEYILIPVGEMAQKIHGMVSVTESGQLLWNKLQQSCSETELVDALLSEYDVDRTTAEQDVRDFVTKMDQLGLLAEDGDK